MLMGVPWSVLQTTGSAADAGIVAYCTLRHFALSDSMIIMPEDLQHCRRPSGEAAWAGVSAADRVRCQSWPYPVSLSGAPRAVLMPRVMDVLRAGSPNQTGMLAVECT
jgi:hypothetical protein